MLYRMEEKKAFELVGRSIVTQNTECDNRDIPVLWNRMIGSGDCAALAKLGTSGKTYGACFPVNGEDRSFRYAVATIVEGDGKGIPGGWERVPVAAGKWAVFPAKGKIPDVFGDLWKRIFSEWLPSHEYEVDHSRPDMENYLDDGVEIWLPVQPPAEPDAGR